MVVLYCLSVALFMTLIVLVPKSEKPTNGLSWMFLSYLIMISCGYTVAYLMNLVGIPINLTSMTVLNGIFIILLLLYIIKNKKLQSLAWIKYDCIVVSLLTVCFAILVIWVFGTSIRLSYTNGDPATHFRMAMEIVRTGTIDGMYFNNLHNALIIEIFQPFLTEIKLYKAFILGNTLTNYLILITFYFLISKYASNKTMKILVPIICILYFAGFPLNAYVRYGFAYLSMGILLVGYILFIANEYVVQENKMKKNILLLGLIIGFFSIAKCYMLFSPIVGLGIFVVVLFDYIVKNNIKINKKLILQGCIVLLVIGICVLFAVLEYFGGSLDQFFYSLKAQGGTYNELYLDFIYFVPFIVYYFRRIWKKDKFTPCASIFITFGVCTAMMFVFMLLGQMSSYYYIKMYSPIWLLGFVLITRALEDMTVHAKEFMISYCSFLAVLILMTFGDVWNVTYDNLENVNKTIPMPLYAANVERMQYDFENVKFPQEFMDLYEYVLVELDHVETVIPVLVELSSYNRDGRWYEAMTGRSVSKYQGWNYTFDELWEMVNQDKLEYVVILTTSEMYKENQETIDAIELERVYENSKGFVLKLR